MSNRRAAILAAGSDIPSSNVSSIVESAANTPNIDAPNGKHSRRRSREDTPVEAKVRPHKRRRLSWGDVHASSGEDVKSLQQRQSDEGTSALTVDSESSSSSSLLSTNNPVEAPSPSPRITTPTKPAPLHLPTLLLNISSLSHSPSPLPQTPSHPSPDQPLITTRTEARRHLRKRRIELLHSLDRKISNLSKPKAKKGKTKTDRKRMKEQREKLVRRKTVVLSAVEDEEESAGGSEEL
ncbi:hypothetical protein HK097_003887 [Rhizophlyctis rosea]|uniref:Uncharacterized protein n=1 Tax=Rhizophlyctis rosea TaxID=64517 RepID=A0AAD5WWZ7_9FUNG|nr:hypothetical protein HK097_003887 [Rhizophlyctis rosea]